jgi:hypothetical protein
MRPQPAVWIGATIVIVAALRGATARADANYAIADGAAELAVSIDPGESMVWLNTFPVDPGGSYIDAIRVAYGRVGGPSALNGLPIRILLYEDVNGGSPQDAVLKWSLSATIANANTNVLNVYRVPELLIAGNLVAAVLFENTTAEAKGIGALDRTLPTFPNRSYVGFFAGSIDPTNLGAIPAEQFGTIEGFGSAGNFRVEAHGRTAVDDPAVTLMVDPSAPAGLVHLTFTGSQTSFDVERATSPDFSDGQIVATGLSGPTFDDTTWNDGQTWYYRVR